MQSVIFLHQKILVKNNIADNNFWNQFVLVFTKNIPKHSYKKKRGDLEVELIGELT